MNFKLVLGALLLEFKNQAIDFALIGGLALNLAGIDRQTQDVDFLVLSKDADKIDRIMKGLGYDCAQRTPNLANYHGLSTLGQVDFIFAHRKHALGMLQRAETHDLLGFKLKAVIPEDLIGLKVQSSSNDPKRFKQDMLDIENLLKSNKRRMELDLVREYFKLFKREKELDEILKEKT